MDRAAARPAKSKWRLMENKSPYVLIGAAMLLFLAGLAGFVVWKLRAGDATSFAYYSILFSGEVQGLTKDSPVFYRGLRVGRVNSVSLTSRVEPQHSTGRERLTEKIEVIVAVDSKIDIRERSYAVFEKPFIAGAPYIEIVGRLEVDQIKPKHGINQKPYPEIREGASFLQVTSTSAQELLSKAGTTVDRLNELLNPDNIASVNETLRSLSTFSSALAKQDANIQATLADLPPALVEFRATFAKLSAAAESFAQIAAELGPQDEASRKALAGKSPSDLRKTVIEAQKAMASINATADQLNKLVADVKGPLRSFSDAGLTELSMTLRDIRQLVANFNVIATKLERDPAGFVYSGKQGYTPK
jgi:phospholipid/cholesterol/gamma-HCH transport system substrate-binding protein